MRFLVVFSSFLTSHLALASIPVNDSINFNGDVRGGYYNAHRNDRDGSESNNNQWRLRLRMGFGAKISRDWSAQLRYAGRFTSDQDSSEFVWDGSAPKTDGLEAGQSTFDEVYLNYQHANWRVKFGRLQTKFELKGVARKSLDRNDSPNTDITWTDGVFATYSSESKWKTNIILQRNLSSGATNVKRYPLNFNDSGSRLSTMLAIENNEKAGIIVQRGINVSYLPDSLLKDGTTIGRIEDYWGITAKTAAAWHIAQAKMRFMLAGEIGYAPETPSNAALKIDKSGNANGGAFQISANFIEFLSQHSIGIVYGYVGGGWLLSPDFRNNNTLVEARYKWQITKKFKFEARIRQRKDLEQLASAQQKREDVDYYGRLTYKW